MTSLRPVLAKHRLDASLGGVDVSVSRRETLRADLAAVSSRNTTLFWVCFGSLIVLFALSLFVVLRYIEHPDRIAAVFGVTGLSVLGVVTQMVRLWKEKVSADLLLVLAASFKHEDIRAIIDILLKKL